MFKAGHTLGGVEIAYIGVFRRVGFRRGAANRSEISAIGFTWITARITCLNRLEICFTAEDVVVATSEPFLTLDYTAPFGVRIRSKAESSLVLLYRQVVAIPQFGA